MIGFALVTTQEDAEAGYKLFNGLRTDAELDAIEKLGLEVGLLSAIRNLPNSSKLRRGWQAFTLDLVRRLEGQENVGPEHRLTIFAKYYLGDMYRSAYQREKGGQEIASALATARQIFGPRSRDVLGMKGGLAITEFDEVAVRRGDILQPLLSILKLLRDYIDLYGNDDPFIPDLTLRIRRACQVLKKVARQTEEIRAALATADELMSAYKL
jgi:hypothetical protein